MAECPVCGCNIQNTDVELGELLTCPDCGSDLETTSVSPVVFQEAPEEEEDWGE
ncbi:lysine biosynthesis protein LysW [[Eubacterium] cellulosolvens]